MIPFSATLRSEWTKLTTLRSVRVMTGLSVLLAVGLTVALSFAVGHSQQQWSPADRASFEPISFSMVGELVTAIFFTVIGVRAGTAEYASGIVRVTFAATPRRNRVVTAKVIAVSALVTAAGTATVVTEFLAGQVILASYGAQHAALTDGDALRTVLTTALLEPVLPVFGLALGLVLRSTAGALVSVLALVFGPVSVDALLPQSWHTLLRWLPDAASTAITQGHLPDAPHGLWPGTAAAVLAGWVALLVVVAWGIVERRDA